MSYSLDSAFPESDRGKVNLSLSIKEDKKKEKRVVSEPIEMTQEFRYFDFASPWEASQRGSKWPGPGEEADNFWLILSSIEIRFGGQIKGLQFLEETGQNRRMAMRIAPSPVESDTEQETKVLLQDLLLCFTGWISRHSIH